MCVSVLFSKGTTHHTHSVFKKNRKQQLTITATEQDACGFMIRWPKGKQQDRHSQEWIVVETGATHPMARKHATRFVTLGEPVPRRGGGEKCGYDDLIDFDTGRESGWGNLYSD